MVLYIFNTTRPTLKIPDYLSYIIGTRVSVVLNKNFIVPIVFNKKKINQVYSTYLRGKFGIPKYKISFSTYILSEMIRII